MEEEVSIGSYTELLNTHFFVYQGKQFPFNINYFKGCSLYFNSSKYQLVEKTKINILDELGEDIHLTDSSINDFISFCHKDKIKLNLENTPILLRLAKKFEVPSLIKVTENYMLNHKKEFVIDFLNMMQNQDKAETKETKEYEEILSDCLPDFIQNDQLLSLPIFILHRVMTKYQLKNSNHQQSKEMIDFLFKCLDQFGKEASVLFESVDFYSARSEVIRRLLTDYSDKFDFHFINSNQLKNFYEIENRIIKGEENMKNEQIKMVTEITEINRHQEEMNRQRDEQHERRIQEIQSSFNEEIERMKRGHEEAIQRQKDEFEGKISNLSEIVRNLSEKVDQHERRNQEIQSSFNEKIERMKRGHEEAIQRQKDEFERKISNLSEIVRNLSEKVDQHENSIGELINKSKEKNYPMISRIFLGESNPEGIISYLKDVVKLSAGGKHHQEYPVTNIYINDNSKYFYNHYNGYSPSSENDSYIKFDFGQSKRIDLYSYLIRSNGNSSSSHYHAKSWRIEGSNDESDWKRLDHRENDENLNGPYKQHHFECQESRNGDKNNRYRFIRWVQEESWLNNYPYCVYITYFELYGDIFDYSNHE